MQTEPEQESERRPRVPVLQLGALALLAALLVMDLIEDSAGTSRDTSRSRSERRSWPSRLLPARGFGGWLRGGDSSGAWTSSGQAFASQAEVERWRNEAHEALQGLGAAIEKQCDRWALTDAERAVAMLLLKGLSMKEIADARGTAERTTRQQALAVYRKAGLAGRAELAAFFLEDLLLPSTTGGGR